MREILAEWEDEANAVPVKCDPLFSEYVQKWIEKKAVSLRANTVKSYRDYAEVHILPALGGLKVRLMTLQHLQTYYKHKLETLKIEAERTKTEKSRRVIDLIESAIPYLIILKQTHRRQGLSLWKVCVWPDEREVQPNYITHRTKRIMEKYGLERIRIHDLRHTAASLLATRAAPKQVQEFLDREDISTTMNVYTHLLDADRKVVSGIMDGILKNSVFYSEKCSESKSAKN